MMVMHDALCIARVAELVDALASGVSVLRTWGFKSPFRTTGRSFFYNVSAFGLLCNANAALFDYLP